MTTTTTWQTPRRSLVLEKNRVHIWRANLDLPPAKIANLSNLLSTDEVNRANKFRFVKHKQRFIAARGILRELLGNYLDIDPKSLVFQYSDRGKPLLTNSSEADILQFNISHSHNYGLYGFAIDDLIGVDIEHLREMPDAVKIAKRFFAPVEYEFIASLDSEQQQQVFFRLWTAKEAYLKAVGTGLTGSLAGVTIALDRFYNIDLMTVEGNNLLADSWSIYSCIPTTDYVAAIAVERQISEGQIDFWHWNQDL